MTVFFALHTQDCLPHVDEKESVQVMQSVFYDFKFLFHVCSLQFYEFKFLAFCPRVQYPIHQHIFTCFHFLFIQSWVSFFYVSNLECDTRVIFGTRGNSKRPFALLLYYKFGLQHK